MKVKGCEGLVKNVVDIVEMTYRRFAVGATKSQREEGVIFVYQICEGTGFAFVRLRPDLAICYRKTDKGETFFLISYDDQSDWVEEMESGFAGLGYRFETRKVENLDSHLLNLGLLFSGKGPV